LKLAENFALSAYCSNLLPFHRLQARSGLG
jgi:hypothetical protein